MSTTTTTHAILTVHPAPSSRAAIVAAVNALGVLTAPGWREQPNEHSMRTVAGLTESDARKQLAKAIGARQKDIRAGAIMTNWFEVRLVYDSEQRAYVATEATCTPTTAGAMLTPERLAEQRARIIAASEQLADWPGAEERRKLVQRVRHALAHQPLSVVRLTDIADGVYLLSGAALPALAQLAADYPGELSYFTVPASPISASGALGALADMIDNDCDIHQLRRLSELGERAAALLDQQESAVAFTFLDKFNQ